MSCFVRNISVAEGPTKRRVQTATLKFLHSSHKYARNKTKIRVRRQTAKDGQLGLMIKIVVPYLYHYASIVKLAMSNIHNNFDLSYCYRQTRNTMIPRICHIQRTRCVNEESLTGKQLYQSTSFSLPSSHKNVFFCIFIPFHHTMTVPVRHVDSLFFID